MRRDFLFRFQSQTENALANNLMPEFGAMKMSLLSISPILGTVFRDQMYVHVFAFRSEIGIVLTRARKKVNKATVLRHGHKHRYRHSNTIESLRLRIDPI